MKRVFCAVVLFMLCVFLQQGVVFAQEIYQDENGVWTNLPKSGLKTELNDLGERAFDGAVDGYVAGVTALGGIIGEQMFKEQLKGSKERAMQGEFRREQAQRAAEEARIREYERTHISDLSSYERFDDPRDKKK